MKKFLFKIIILFTILGVCDFLFGKGVSYVLNNIQIGGMGRDNYICKEANEDILVFGSSRAVHHYNSQMIEDSLGLSCYNCGDDGNGIILSYGRLTMVKQRHLPKVVIYDVAIWYDLFKNDNHTYLGSLKSRYDIEGIPEIFDAVDKTERCKMFSQMYRYNSNFLQYLFVYFTGISGDNGIKGFRPLRAEMDTMMIQKNQKPKKYEFDPLKIELIDRFIELTDGAQLVFVVSPIWYGMDTNQTMPIQEICKKRNIPFLDYSNNPKYVYNNKYFKDGSHLNARGADEFTRDLINDLKSMTMRTPKSGKGW